MISSTPNQPSAAAGSSSTAVTLAAEGSGKKLRKPYTITKSRESWTEEEHDKFLEALQLFDRDWKKIEDFVGSKTVIQIRSHAQKYFMKVQKNGTEAHVPPPRPKRKAAHPYPQKAPKNVLAPLPVTMAYSSSLHSVAHSTWDEASVLLNSASNGFMPPEDGNNHSGAEVGAGLKRSTRMSSNTVSGGGSSCNTTSEMPKQGKGSILGIPNFSEIYGFIGSVFDPDTKGHAQKLNEMDPINFETVSLLMRNLTINLSSPNFEPVRKVLSSYDVDSGTVALSVGDMDKKG